MRGQKHEQAAGVGESLTMDGARIGAAVIARPHDLTFDVQVALVRMDAGARYPSHRHREIEELFMLAGHMDLFPG